MRVKHYIISLMAFFMIFGTGSIVSAQSIGETNADIVVESVDELQNALTSAAEIGTDQRPCVIYVKAGTYNVERSLHIYGNTYLRLDDGAVIKRVFDSDDCSCLIRTGKSADNLNKYDGYKNITIDGGCWDGNGENSQDDHFSILRAGHITNIIVKNTTMKNDKGGHYIECAAIKNMTVENCTFRDMIDGDSENGKEAIEFDVTHDASNFSSFNNYDETPCIDVSVTNCKFINVARGLGTHTSSLGIYYDNIKILNNYFENIEEIAINAQSFRHSTISNNEMKNVLQGIRFTYMSDEGVYFFVPKGFSIKKYDSNADTDITDNTITLCSAKGEVAPFGIRSMGYNVTSKSKNYTKYNIPVNNYLVKNLRIKNNKINVNENGYGIRFMDTFDSVIESNTVEYNISKKADSYSGIYLSDSCCNNTINNNTIGNADKYGIGCIDESNNNVISNNSIDKSGHSGIYLGHNSINNTVKGNKVSNSIRQGIYVNEEASAKTIDKNIIEQSGENGIYINAGAKGDAISNNQIIDCKKHAIYINESTAGKVISNVIAKDSYSESCVRGVCVFGKRAAIKQIVSNSISNCSEHGIVANGSAAVDIVENNTISDVKVNGIYSNESAKMKTINENSIANAGNCSIKINSNAQAMTISNNIISGSRTYGIDLVKGLKATVSNNIISDCKTSHIRVQGKKNIKIKYAKLTISSAKAKKGKIELKYKKKSGVSKYVIYKSTKKDSGYKLLTSTTKTKYIDKKVKKGKTYYYKLAYIVKVDKVTVTVPLMGNAKKIKAK